MNRNKKIIRLTESKLRRIITESVVAILRENNNVMPNNITPKQVLQIVSNAIATNNYEVIEANFECITNRDKVGYIDFDYVGEMFINFYADDNATQWVCVTTSAWANLYCEDDYVDYYSDISAGIDSIKSVEFSNKGTFTPVQMGEMINKLGEMISTEELEAKYAHDISGVIETIEQKEGEDYQMYLDGQMDAYNDSFDDRY
jgi:hypothetical protein